MKMESLKNESNDIIPKDTCKLAYIIHFLLGAGNLLPWNALITAIDYFGHLYPDKHVEKVFSVAYMGSSLLALICMIKWSNINSLASFKVRMNVGFTMFVVSLMVSPTLDWVCRHEKSASAFYVVVASVVICGLADGLIGGSLIGSAGKLPKEYMQAVFAGTASSGFLAENIKSKLLKDWYPIMLIAIYNIADFGGKSFTAFYVLNSIAKATWGCLGRLLLYPLFTACLHGPKWLKNEVFVVFLTVMLGFTNGYLTSVIMILAPKSVPPLEEERAAIVMALFLGLGLVSGSALG
ncbi:hypothetical protein M8C21_001093, partial [Ambrosia artemisiifolia]